MNWDGQRLRLLWLVIYIMGSNLARNDDIQVVLFGSLVNNKDYLTCIFTNMTV